MTTQLIKGTEVTRPTPAPLTSSILDQATVVDNGRFGLTNDNGLWPSYNCMDTLVPTVSCPEPQVGFKTFDTAPWVPAFQFVYYGGVQCGAVGLDKADMRSEIARVFALNEGKGIERALVANRFVARAPVDATPGVEATPGWDEPVDLTASGMTLPGAIGALEGYAAAHYAGVPTFHMPRAAVVIAFGLGLLKENSGLFYTKTGAKIAAGGGYDDPDVPADGVFDLYATGEVYIERSSTVDVGDVFVLPGDGSGIGSDENGLSDNTVLGFAERMYRVAIDCFVAKATATVWS